MPLPLNLLPIAPTAGVPAPCNSDGSLDNRATSCPGDQPFGSFLEQATTPDDPAAAGSQPDDGSTGAAPSAPTTEQFVAAMAFLVTPNTAVPPPAPVVITADSSPLCTDAVAGDGTAGALTRFTSSNPTAQSTASAQCSRQTVNALLAQGSPVLEFQIQDGIAVPTNSPALVEDSLRPGEEGSVLPLTSPPAPDSGSASATTAAGSPTDAEPAPAATASSPSAQAAASLANDQASQSSSSFYRPNSVRSTGTRRGAEKIAAGGRDGEFSLLRGDKSPDVKGKNQLLVADNESLKGEASLFGTSGANRVFAMVQTRQNSDDLSASSTLPSASMAGRLESNSSTELAAPSSSAASHAGALVHEIREIADGMWAIERNSVEVRFKFADDQPLSVRIEYRNGSVQATFRTDSAELRDVIAQQWQSQAASADQRPYRFADPLFDASRSGANAGFAADANGGRQQSQQQPRSPDQPAFSSHFSLSGDRSGETTTITSAGSRPSRPDTALHLHTFA